MTIPVEGLVKCQSDVFECVTESDSVSISKLTCSLLSVVERNVVISQNREVS